MIVGMCVKSIQKEKYGNTWTTFGYGAALAMAGSHIPSSQAVCCLGNCL